MLDLPDGKPRAFSPEGYRSFSRGVSPDGKFVLAEGPDRRRYLYPIEGGEPTPIPGLAADDTPEQWTADGRSLYVSRRRDIPSHVQTLDLATGRRSPWRDLAPADGSGVVDVAPIIPTPDGGSYIYGYSRTCPICTSSRTSR